MQGSGCLVLCVVIIFIMIINKHTCIYTHTSAGLGCLVLCVIIVFLLIKRHRGKRTLFMRSSKKHAYALLIQRVYRGHVERNCVRDMIVQLMEQVCMHVCMSYIIVQLMEHVCMYVYVYAGIHYRAAYGACMYVCTCLCI